MSPSRPSSRPALPAAVSTLVAEVVHGELAPATVVGVHRFALYLSVRGGVLPLVTSDAVALPTAVRLPVTSHDLACGARSAASGARARSGAWGVDVGDTVTVGGGRVRLPAFDAVAARTWRPARVRRAPAAVGCPDGRPGSHLSTRLRVSTSTARAALPDAGSGWLADGIRAACAPTATPRVECGGGGQGDHVRAHGEAAVAGLVGRGPGLTPSGDDALAGALLVAHALGAATHLAPAVRARLGATTAVSAALLSAAADGYAARPVVALVDAAVAADPDAVARALPPVLAIGHGSGRDTVTGIRAALDALSPQRGQTTNDRSAA